MKRMNGIAAAALALAIGGVATPVMAQEKQPESAAVKSQENASAAQRLERAADRLERATDKLAQSLERMEQAQSKQPSQQVQQKRQQQQQQKSSTEAKSSQQQDGQGRYVGTIMIVPLPQRVPDGLRVTPLTDGEGIRDTLAELTEAAFTKSGFNDVVERFVDFDRNRVGLYAERDFETLDGRIAQLQKAWRDKYGGEFEIDESRVFGDGFKGLEMVQAESVNPVLLAANWPIEPTPKKRGDFPGRADYVVDDAELEVRNVEQKNLGRGRDLAVVSFPAQHGLPTINVSMIQEAWGWKIDVPNGVSGRDVRRNLLNHLTWLGEHVDQWPADETEAQRLIAHHVAMASYGLDVPGYSSKKQGQQAQNQQ